MASSSLQEKWLDDQFQTWLQIITARILSDPAFKLALLGLGWLDHLCLTLRSRCTRQRLRQQGKCV